MIHGKKFIRIAAVILAAALMLAGCSSGSKSPKPEKGRAGSDAYAEIFAPLLEGFFWGMLVQDIPSDLGIASDEAIRGDGMLTIPLSMVVKVYEQDMTVWMKYDEENGAGLYEMTLRFDPALYPEIRDRMIKDFGPYQVEGDPEKSVFFQSRQLADYYTEEEVREIYLNIMEEEALTEDLMKQLMESCEFTFSVRSGGTIGMSARNYLAMKQSVQE
ncbi:MAG: hypothetical protein IKR59_02470 [Lachnospiraceae bacterium]|nr:hypothetical protein [Lachnospiraceae bacterium]